MFLAERLNRKMNTMNESAVKEKSMREIPNWHSQAMPLLGKISDAKIAQQLGLTVRQVFHLRTKFQIAPVCKVRWKDPYVLRSLGVKKDAELAKEIGVNPETVRKHRAKIERKHERWGMPEQARDMLGKITDSEMAHRFGRSRETVRGWRHKYKIPPLRKRQVWKKQEILMLGTMPDKLVARLCGRRLEDVRKKRLSLAIGEYLA